MPQKLASQSDAAMDRVARLVVKEGIALGNLGESDRSLALAWVWAGVDTGGCVERLRLERDAARQARQAAWQATRQAAA